MVVEVARSIGNKPQRNVRYLRGKLQGMKADGMLPIGESGGCARPRNIIDEAVAYTKKLEEEERAAGC